MEKLYGINQPVAEDHAHGEVGCQLQTRFLGIIMNIFWYFQKVHIPKIERDDFISWTKSIWTFPAVNAKKIGHPAPFPVELPHRLINLYSYEGDVVLDPFCGSGTTCIAAVQNNRSYIAYDIKREYVELAEKRISNQKFI